MPIMTDDALESVRNADQVAERERSSEPFLAGFGWSLSAPPGGIVMGRVTIRFPDPAAVPPNSGLYVHAWIGTDVSGVDDRFPRLTQPKVPGLQPGLSQVPEFPAHPDTALLDFRLQVPPDVALSVYLGNVALLRRLPFEPDEVLDRTTFAFRVRGADEPPDLNPGV